MKLNILVQANSFDEIKKEVRDYFKQDMRILKEERSIFTSWSVRPSKRIFVPEVWKYRIFFNEGSYYFGTIGEIVLQDIKEETK
jgi:hypothetical protein